MEEIYHASSKIYAQKLIEQTTDDQMVSDILHSNYEMLNAIGIMNHHDAITGTATLPVSKEYAVIMTDAVQYNKGLYSHLIGEQSQKAGFNEETEWDACTVSTTESVNCGIDGSIG